MRALIGTRLDGATLTETDVTGGVGRPVWGPKRFLRDLELRLGIPEPITSSARRLAAWRARLDDHLGAEPTAFYARSYAIDPLGTSQMLLEWRDALVEGGWDGLVVPDGGARLTTLAQVEARPTPPSLGPLGLADRLAHVERTLDVAGTSPYSAITLADSPAAWPGRWRRVFERLERGGTVFERIFLPRISAPPGSDLERLQTSLARGTVATDPGRVRGDGSLVLLTAPTTLEAADVVAAFVRTLPSSSYVFVRGGEPALLDDALIAHGLPSLGGREHSRWRSALQLLPLFVDLLFEPPDPRRLLELFDLRVSPIPSSARYALARALCDEPGIGGPRWLKEKQRLRDRGVAVEDVEAWLEVRRYAPEAGVPKEALLLLCRRLRDWLASQIGSLDGESRAVALEAGRQCAELEALVETGPTDPLERVALRHALHVVKSDGVDLVIYAERAGRADHVDEPAALLGTRSHVVWWHFVANAAAMPHRARWRRSELDALARAGVRLVDPSSRMQADASSWRQAVLGATESLVLVTPTTNRGDAQAHHPLWEEITARLGLDERAARRITITAADALARRRWTLPTESLARLELPAGRATWSVPPGTIPVTGPWAPYAVQELLECPLRSVLGRLSATRPSSVPSLPEGPMLAGILAHRLVEVLVERDALTGDRTSTREVLDGLLPLIGAMLLQPGMSVELHQLRHQLEAATLELATALRRSGHVVVACEEQLHATWLELDLHGRLDLLVADTESGHAIIDLKWGRRGQLDQLRRGRALQLALYAHMVRRQLALHALPATAYFSLSRAQLLSTDEAMSPTERIEGPSTAQTLERLTRTVPLVRAALERGTIHVTGTVAAVSVLSALGVPEEQRPAHFETEVGDGCRGCSHDAVCGRGWEGSW